MRMNIHKSLQRMKKKANKFKKKQDQAIEKIEEIGTEIEKQKVETSIEDQIKFLESQILEVMNKVNAK